MTAGPERTVVIGTAGHIDHGKTSLLRALTGIDADRLPEERARGMTIDVGYAYLAFDDGVELDFVDVPGHDRLIGNMLVGAGEIDAAMLIVAADDGPRPQTIEHVQLLDALGVADGLAVITKTDLVEAGRLAEVAASVRALLAETSLAGAPVLDASSATGEGIDRVRSALREVRDAVLSRDGRRAARPPFLLSIDRAFGAKGRGTVVTGTLWGGPLARGAALRREPGGDVVRVREVQVHGAEREQHGGGRTALNLAGIATDGVRRGDVLTSDPRVHGTARLLVERFPARVVTPPLPGSRPREPRRPGAGALLRLHIGTNQVDATARGIRDDAAALVLNLASEAAAFPGQRAVLRDPASGVIVAGVRVLDPQPPRGASRRRLTADRVAALRASMERDWPAIDTALLELHGAQVHIDAAGSRVLALADDVRRGLDEAALGAVAAHHRDAPMSPGLPLPRVRAAVLRRLRSLVTVERRDLDLVAVTVASAVNQLVAQGRLVRRDDIVSDPVRGAAEPAELTAAMGRLERALDVAAPPGLAEAAAAAGCPPEGIRALQAAGRMVRLGPDLAWATSAFHRLAGAALERARDEPLTPAAFRDATGTSRKYVLAILEDLDRREILQRTPAGHVPGPRAPQPTAATPSTAGPDE